MVRIIVVILLIYLALQFLFKFLLPVIRATRQMKGQVRDFQNRMQEQQDAFQQQQTTPQQEATPKRKGDYIEYEELK